MNLSRFAPDHTPPPLKKMGDFCFIQRKNISKDIKENIKQKMIYLLHKNKKGKNDQKHHF